MASTILGQRFGTPVSTTESSSPSTTYALTPPSPIRCSPGRTCSELTSVSVPELQDGQVALQLVGGDVGLVGVPLLALVADQVLVDVVAQALPHHLGTLG